VNPALAAPAGIVTVLGTVTVESLLDRFTVKPPLGAAAVRVTVQVSVPAPVMVPLLQVSALKAAGAAVPEPLSVGTAAPNSRLKVSDTPLAAAVSVTV
jgi:hypothetical protein